MQKPTFTMQMSLVCFIRLYRKKTLCLVDDKCFGGKHSKIRMTGLDAANMNNDKLAMFVIGKSKSIDASKISKITLSLPKPEQKLDGFNTFRKFSQRA